MVDHPDGRHDRSRSFRKEVEQMRKGSCSLPVDANKLRNLLDQTHIPYRQMSESMGYSHNQLSNVISTGSVSKPVAKLLETLYGIKYEQYELKKAEPKLDVQPEIVATTKTEQQLKTIIAQLSLLNNNLIGAAELLRKIDKDIKIVGCDSGD